MLNFDQWVNDMGNDTADQTVIEGIVTPCDWDESGRVIAVALSARDEEEYLIDSSARGRQLISHIHQQVRATGILQAHAEQDVLVVTEYEIISHDGLGEFEDGRRSLSDEKC
jgi:hypothetical protein